ncbi:hypothetical protein M8A51_23505 [Schlegelella sp. S2-27]|uniref:Uncharacterized protein n=1 Tax=Caldimonas mangrovi TaxID=2944811 RepID=A0ABT0YUT0_9BURK|nr:hypothetical protein [Caldimonas mangrovi]MCM5682507.1 hypothetical protein [Caldimonas mangrovi]
MGFSAAALLVAGVAGTAVAMSQKPKMNIPKQTAPDTMSNQEIDQASKVARDRQKQQAMAASGRSDTLLTGPQGVAATPTTGKTLLGQ